jgi:hypothetical protein
MGTIKNIKIKMLIKLNTCLVAVAHQYVAYSMGHSIFAGRNTAQYLLSYYICMSPLYKEYTQRRPHHPP